ncbi:helix-turn-helix domain-containing protein [Streptomyces sp. NPDC058086]|uniref:helix-turn-helix domain-containing protein n=1 Tax=Streptomyces sp. NPDC058086 TaxID=3346334 RepID=UPI0036E2C52C
MPPGAGETEDDDDRDGRAVEGLEGLADQPVDTGDVANTLRYRLTKIEQTVGVNLADPGIRLVFALQLMALAPA